MKSEHDEIIASFVTSKLKEQIKKAAAMGETSILIDFKDVDDFSPELGDYIINNPAEAIDAIKYFINESQVALKKTELEVRIKNLPDTAQILISEIRSKHIGKLVQINGLIKVAISVKPMAKSIDFECQTCGHITRVEQKERTTKPPTICANCGKKGHFKIINKELIDTQKIILEEAPEDLVGGAQPEHMNVILKGDIVDPKFERNIIPGNKVVVSGIVNEEPIIYPSGKKSNTSDIFISASYLEALEQGYEDIEVSKEEEMVVKELAKDKMIYTKFRNSIAPNIFGYDYVKDAIVLQLFGGVRKESGDKSSAVRGDIHILLVGDPGTSKSTLLKYVSTVAPKARYVTGMGSSAAGLTATILKDEATRSYILEAGAMPLTNKGLLAIDEIDKMNKDDRIALHEGLEQQTITISKANIHATLSAQTTVLAAANPKFGRFNAFDMVANQIDLLPTLINRFDLIFIMKDRPNNENDKKIAKRILEANRDINKNKPDIPTAIMKKFIAYAKQNIKPVLSSEAISVIEDFYLKLRAQYSTEGQEVRPIPISARQLEALIRMTEASAKVRLSDMAVVEDAKRAVDLMMAYLSEVGVDKSTGELDIDRVISGISSSQRGTIISVKSIIKAELDSLPAGSMLAITKVYEDAEKSGIKKDSVDDAISKLKKEGEIFEPKMGFVKLL
jgi:replicative DNA helicase Mcm